MTYSMTHTLNLPQQIGSQALDAMGGPVCIRLQDPKARLNLRIAAHALKDASQAFGLDIPDHIHGYVEAGGRSALCLGPDEWLLLAPEGEYEGILTAFSALYERCAHSLTDISDRQVCVSLKGDQVLDLLSIACPRDLSQLAVETGTRTLFDTVEVTLVRRAEDHFEMDVWRSFLPHVWALLHIGNQELASDAGLSRL